MINIYCLYIRSVAEQSSVVWSTSITSGEVNDLERIQKVALRIILQSEYIDYNNALKIANLQTLRARISLLCQKFALKCTQNYKTSDMFPLNQNNLNASHSEKNSVTKKITSKLANFAIPMMQRQLNRLSQNRK